MKTAHTLDAIALIEAEFSKDVTTRNWNTILKTATLLTSSSQTCYPAGRNVALVLPGSGACGSKDVRSASVHDSTFITCTGW